MNFSISSLATWIFIIFFITPSFGQESIDKIIESIEKYHQTYPYEKVYLHTDKPHYFLNDTIWIKAYGLIELGKEDPEKTPTVPLYVELLQDRVLPYVSRIIMKLENGMGQGDIVLPRNLRPGVYTLRAYTEWMMNFGEEAFFEKNIWVGELGDGWEFINQNPKLNLSFFPEGGYLVEGIESKVGFKATNAIGKGTDVLGYILNSKMDTILRFESEHLGMGAFNFNPVPNESYEIRAKSAEQDWTRFAFSAIQKTGYVLKIDPLYENDQVKISVLHNKVPQPKSLHIIGLSKGKVVFRKDLDAGKQENSFFLDKEDFMPGLVTFTLMDDETQLLAERLVYFLPFSQASGKFRTEKSEYGPKEMVRMDIELNDEFGMPVEGDFSISVTDAYQVMHLENSENIVSYFQLSSDLKGVLEQPSYYFNPENPNAEKYLDILLLTQGWRRFSWENLSKLNELPPYQFESGLSLSGKVFKLNNKPVEEIHKLTLLVNHWYGDPLVYEGETDASGRFTFLGMDYQDTVGIFLQAYLEKEKASGKKKELKRNELEIFEKEIPKPKMASLIGLPQGDQFIDYEDYLVTVKEARNLMEQFVLNKEIELGEVTVRGRRSDQIPDTRTIQYNDSPELSMTVTDEYYGFQNVYHLIRGRFPGVTVYGDVFNMMNPPAILMRGGLISGPASGRPAVGGAAIFIDGSPATPQLAATIPVAEIERVDILRSLAKSAVYGSQGAGGVVNILTKGGNPNRDYSEVDILGNATLVTQGYAPIREFYVPPMVPDISAPIAIDYRSTIFWLSFVESDMNGKVYLEFPLSEGRPEVRVSLEGLSKKGEPIYSNYTFKVK
ncbi:TonB-dependent receptor [Shivajiella indica]|uniref:TonB-dependent receptor n=1 Tax=Shivajiella indica TaxID=872115 RepID=A0ABW5B7N9_9BACT